MRRLRRPTPREFTPSLIKRKVYQHKKMKPAATGLVIFFVALLTLSISPVNALCTQWDVSGKWNIEQENPTAHVELDLKQRGTEITGTATYDGVPGKVKGAIVGQDFNVEISCATGQHVFRGVVGPER